jgi:transposase
MKQPTAFVGLDVSKETIALAVAPGGSDEAPRELGVIPHDYPKLRARLLRLGRPGDLRVAYEAGPTGYGLHRRLSRDGFDCQVIAPSLVPKLSTDQVKTDRRDALKLARFLRSGDLTSIYVPKPADEALRDLFRARQDAKRAQLTARHQLSKLLLRHDLRWRGGRCHWTLSHLKWIAQLRFDEPALQITCADYLHEVERLASRIAMLEQGIAELAPRLAQGSLVQALQALRGVKLLTAAGVVCEVGDFRRFSRAPSFMSFTGLVPSECSSGAGVRRGAITKAGNGHLRWLLVEAAWAYRHKPRIGQDLRARSEHVSPRVCDIAWKAQVRLHRLYWRLVCTSKPSPKALVAVARELAGFIWAIAQEEELVR